MLPPTILSIRFSGFWCSRQWTSKEHDTKRNGRNQIKNNFHPEVLITKTAETRPDANEEAYEGIHKIAIDKRASVNTSENYASRGPIHEADA